MAKYSKEIKARARDYYEIHSYTFGKISQIIKVPATTIGDWKKANNWVKGSLKSKVDETKDLLNQSITDNRIFNKVKEELVAQMKCENPSMMTTSVEDDVIIEQRAVSLLLEAASIENFDAMAMDGMKLAYKKLKYMNGLSMERISMGEIKVYTDIVNNVKAQVFGKAPDTVIQLNNSNMNVDDLSKLDTEQLYARLDKMNKKEVMDNSIGMM